MTESTVTENSFPELVTKPREEIVISHSNVFYWWPAWLGGYILAAVSYLQGTTFVTEGGNVSYMHPSNNVGLLFIALLVLLIIFTNAKLRGIYSVLTLVTLGFFAVLFAWLGIWDDIFDLIPDLSARANMGFYLVFATTMLIVWLASYFIFDRLTYWRVRPGQFSEISMIGGGTKNYDSHGLRFERREQDYFRHVVLGLGAGDLVLTGKELPLGTIVMQNVAFVTNKAKNIERLIVVKPDA